MFFQKPRQLGVTDYKTCQEFRQTGMSPSFKGFRKSHHKSRILFWQWDNRQVRGLYTFWLVTTQSSDKHWIFFLAAQQIVEPHWVAGLHAHCSLPPLTTYMQCLAAVMMLDSRTQRQASSVNHQSTQWEFSCVEIAQTSTASCAKFSCKLLMRLKVSQITSLIVDGDIEGEIDQRNMFSSKY